MLATLTDPITTLLREVLKFSAESKENNKKSSANILPFDDKNDSTIGKPEGF